MQMLSEAANHIAQEIERTRQHLTTLEQALEGLKPLITIDAATANLSYAASAPVEPIEDLSVVNAEAPEAKKRGNSKVAAETITAKVRSSEKVPVAKPTKLPSTGTELWLKCMGRKKVSLSQIVDAALKKLELDDSVRDVISGRVKTWINFAVKKGMVISAGMKDGHKLLQLAPAKLNVAVEHVEAAESVEAPGIADSAEVA